MDRRESTRSGRRKRCGSPGPVLTQSQQLGDPGENRRPVQLVALPWRELWPLEAA